MTAPDLSPAEAEIVARFEAAPDLPESYRPSSPVALLDQLDELRANATPGPWALDPDRIGGFDLLDADGEFIADRLGALMQSDAALIVGSVNAVGPLTAAVRAVLDAHVPWYEIKGVRHEHTVSASCEAVGCDGESCDGEHEVPACQECRWSDGDVDGYQFWPCPTVRAITAALSVTP